MNHILSNSSKSPKFLVIAYFTKDTPYQNLAQTLENSLKSLSLDYYIESIEDQGSWESNTHYKAYFIKRCLEQYEQDLLYVDVDAIFRSYPILIDEIKGEGYDIGYRTENFRWRGDEALSGTVYLKNCDNIKAMVNEWISINESRPAERMKPETWEQKNMQTAHRKMQEIKYYNFPPEYTFITDTHRRMFPGVVPIIEHFQESRNYFKNNKK